MARASARRPRPPAGASRAAARGAGGRRLPGRPSTARGSTRRGSTGSREGRLRAWLAGPGRQRLARLGSIRPTSRGATLLVGGLALALAGVGVGVPAMVQLGLVPVLAVLVGSLTVVTDLAGPHRQGRRVTRTVAPHPVTVGERATVTVEVHGRSGLDRAQLSERAARELSGGLPLRAKVTRSPHSVHLTYTISPTRRGRWAAGPLEIHLRDVLGTVRWSGELGATRKVAVRPAITPLQVPGGAAALDTRSASGTRSPAPDDVSLRDYRPGDDPRRVHWRSTARRGELVVRQDERAGRRPATVLLDLPADDDPLEWTVATGASAAVALVDSGHRVRMLAGEDPPTRHHSDALAVELLLDQAVDLVAPDDAVTQRAWLLAALEEITVHGAGSELVVAVVGALDTRTLGDLARVGTVHDAWAMVRAHRTPTLAEEQTLRGLRRGGWAATFVVPGEPVAVAWQRMLELAAAPVGGTR